MFSSDFNMQDSINSLNTMRENVISKKLKAHDKMFRSSFSFGIYKFQKNNALTEVIEQADKEMYHDKIEIKKRVTGIVF